MWTVQYTKRFLKELSKIPPEYKSKAEIVVFNDLRKNNPFELGCMEQMTG
jgi:mRNA interferase RelE/StbE